MPITQKEFEDNYKYYKEKYDIGEPVITDDEFDAYEAMGKEMFPDSDVFNIVGLEGAVTVTHDIPMMSLDKIRDVEKLKEWAGDKEIVATYKMDGCAVSIKYENGHFVGGATRGNGFVGQDITRALNYINFPKIIKMNGEIEVRGELVITKDNFEELKKDMNSRGLKEAKSKRNIIVGLINPLRKTDFDLSKYIDFVLYDFIGNFEFRTEDEKFKYLKSLGFNTPVIATSQNKEGIEPIINWYTEYKDSRQYLTDGIVFTYNDLSLHERTDKNPKHKVAFKLLGEIASTVITQILEHVAGTGIVSFVGCVLPVELNEATINRVTLHNIDYIKKHNINVGATIGITRSGDIIPTHMITYIPNGEYTPPTNCPVCGSPLFKDGAFLICDNQNCNARMLGKLMKWIEVIDAKGISTKTIEGLFNRGMIKTVSDLYKLKIEDIAKLDGFGQISAENIVNTLREASQNVTYDMIIRGANIRNIGKTISKLLIEKYENIDNLCEYLNYNELEHIHGIGEELATLILKSKNQICSFYNEIKEFITIKTKEKNSNILNGKSFCITGTLSKSRNEFKEMIESNGGIVKSGVSGNLDYLLAGDSAGSKLDKAKECEVTVLSEQDFLGLINC